MTPRPGPPLAEILRARLGEVLPHVLVGEVVAIPDASHVEVEINGETVVVPHLNRYLPQEGDVVYLVAQGSLLLVMGTVRVDNAGDIGASSRITSVESTAAITVSSSSEAAPTVVLTLPSATYAARAVRFMFVCPSVYWAGPTGGTSVLYFSLWDDTANAAVKRIGRIYAPSTALVVPVALPHELTPSAGARIYSVRSWKNNSGDAASLGEAGNYVHRLTADYV